MDESDHPSGRVVVVCEGGPAAGQTRVLGAGRHVVGRASTAGIRIADATVEPHHAFLDVGRQGVRLVQLTGRVPCRVDGAPVTTSAAGVAVPAGGTVSLGCSRLRVDRADEAIEVGIGGASSSPAPATLPPDAGQVLVPSEGTSPTGAGDRSRSATVAAAAITVGTAVALTATGRAGRALVLGLILAAAVVGFGAVRRRAEHRARAEAVTRAALLDLEDDLVERRARWLADRRARTPDIAAVVDRLERSAELPELDGQDGAVFAVSLGTGPDRFEPAPITPDGAPAEVPAAPAALALLARLAPVERAPVAAELGPGAVVTLSGPGAGAVSRSLVIQLAASVAPELVRIAVIGEQAGWAAGLPHASGGTAAAGDGRHVVVVTDRVELERQPPGALRDGLGVDPEAAVVLVAEDGAAPTDHGSRLELGAAGTGWWRSHPHEVAARAVHPAGLDEDTAARLVGVIATRRPAPADIPAIDLAQLARARGRGPLDDPIDVAAAWRTTFRSPEAWIGLGASGVITVGVEEQIGPVIVVADDAPTVGGVAGTFIGSLAATAAPAALRLIAVGFPAPGVAADLGGAGAAWGELPHLGRRVAADDADRLADLAADLCDAVEREQEPERQSERERERPGSPRTLVVVHDSVAVALRLGPALTLLAARGPAAGIHLLITATSRGVSPWVEAMLDDPTAVRIVGRVADPGLARRAVGDTRPVRLGPDAALVRRPGIAAELVRLPVSMAGGVHELAVWAGAIRQAAALSATTAT